MRLKKAIKILNELNCRRKKKMQYLDPEKYNIEKLKLITKAIDTILNKVQNKNKWGKRVYDKDAICEECEYWEYGLHDEPCEECISDAEQGICYYYKKQKLKL